MPTQPILPNHHGHCDKMATRSIGHSNFARFALRQNLGAIGSVALIVILILGLPVAGSWAAPQTPKLEGKLKNVELCNGVDRSSAEPQIRGCTALIESG